MIYNLKPCHVMGCISSHDGIQTVSSRCDVHEWEVERDFERGPGNGAVDWEIGESRKHEALFRRIAVARARAQVALDAQLEGRLKNIAMWEGDKFDGNFLDGVVSIQFDLPEEDADG